jgi:hypothetical protein
MVRDRSARATMTTSATSISRRPDNPDCAAGARELANPVPGRHYSAELRHFTFDHELNGVIDAQGEDDDDRSLLVVTRNTVTSVRAD